MDRTLRAALLAAVIAFAAVAGFGAFLGFDPVGSVVAGAVCAVLAGALLWGAARRAETFHGPEQTAGPEQAAGPDQTDGSDQPGRYDADDTR